MSVEIIVYRYECLLYFIYKIKISSYALWSYEVENVFLKSAKWIPALIPSGTR